MLLCVQSLIFSLLDITAAQQIPIGTYTAVYTMDTLWTSFVSNLFSLTTQGVNLW